MWTWKRGGVSQVYILLNNPYLGSKMVHKEGGGQKNCPRGLWTAPYQNLTIIEFWRATI